MAPTFVFLPELLIAKVQNITLWTGNLTWTPGAYGWPKWPTFGPMDMLLGDTFELQLSFMNFFIFEKDPSMAHELFPKII
jgi:hypothetical protein